MRAKYDHCHHSSFNHSGDVVGAHQNLNGSCDLTTFLSGIVALATVNLSTNLEVCISTHYKYTTGDTKCRKWGGLG